MGDSSGFKAQSSIGDESATILLTGKILMVGVILLFLVVIFVLFLHIYAKWFWYRREEEDRQSGAVTTRRRRRRFDFAPGHVESSAVFPRRQRAIDPLLLKSLPVIAYEGKDFKDALECPVCLSDFEGGEKLRLLPKCNHRFHVECIDMWFQSHSTCPLCRSAVSSSSTAVALETILQLPITAENPPDWEGPNFPTNVLFCGDETRVITLGLPHPDEIASSSSPPPPPSQSSCSPLPPMINTSSMTNGMIVIDVSRQLNEDEGPKSPGTIRQRVVEEAIEQR